MKTISKRAYESPQAKLFEVKLETAVLQASLDGGDKPTDDAGEGDTGDWGWGN